MPYPFSPFDTTASIDALLSAYGQGNQIAPGNIPIRPDWYSLYPGDTRQQQLDLIGLSQRMATADLTGNLVTPQQTAAARNLRGLFGRFDARTDPVLRSLEAQGVSPAVGQAISQAGAMQPGLRPDVSQGLSSLLAQPGGQSTAEALNIARTLPRGFVPPEQEGLTSLGGFLGGSLPRSAMDEFTAGRRGEFQQLLGDITKTIGEQYAARGTLGSERPGIAQVQSEAARRLATDFLSQLGQERLGLTESNLGRQQQAINQALQYGNVVPERISNAANLIGNWGQAGFGNTLSSLGLGMQAGQIPFQQGITQSGLLGSLGGQQTNLQQALRQGALSGLQGVGAQEAAILGQVFGQGQQYMQNAFQAAQEAANTLYPLRGDLLYPRFYNPILNRVAAEAGNPANLNALGVPLTQLSPYGLPFNLGTGAGISAGVGAPGLTQVPQTSSDAPGGGLGGDQGALPAGQTGATWFPQGGFGGAPSVPPGYQYPAAGGPIPPQAMAGTSTVGGIVYSGGRPIGWENPQTGQVNYLPPFTQGPPVFGGRPTPYSFGDLTGNPLANQPFGPLPDVLPYVLPPPGLPEPAPSPAELAQGGGIGPPPLPGLADIAPLPTEAGPGPGGFGGFGVSSALPNPPNAPYNWLWGGGNTPQFDPLTGWTGFGFGQGGANRPTPQTSQPDLSPWLGIYGYTGQQPAVDPATLPFLGFGDSPLRNADTAQMTTMASGRQFTPNMAQAPAPGTPLSYYQQGGGGATGAWLLNQMGLPRYVPPASGGGPAPLGVGRFDRNPLPPTDATSYWRAVTGGQRVGPTPPWDPRFPERTLMPDGSIRYGTPRGDQGGGQDQFVPPPPGRGGPAQTVGPAAGGGLGGFPRPGGADGTGLLWRAADWTTDPVHQPGGGLPIGQPGVVGPREQIRNQGPLSPVDQGVPAPGQRGGGLGQMPPGRGGFPRPPVPGIPYTVGTGPWNNWVPPWQNQGWQQYMQSGGPPLPMGIPRPNPFGPQMGEQTVPANAATGGSLVDPSFSSMFGMYAPGTPGVGGQAYQFGPGSQIFGPPANFGSGMWGQGNRPGGFDVGMQKPTVGNMASPMFGNTDAFGQPFRTPFGPQGQPIGTNPFPRGRPQWVGGGGGQPPFGTGGRPGLGRQGADIFGGGLTRNVTLPMRGGAPQSQAAQQQQFPSIATVNTMQGGGMPMMPNMTGNMFGNWGQNPAQVFKRFMNPNQQLQGLGMGV